MHQPLASRLFSIALLSTLTGCSSGLGNNLPSKNTNANVFANPNLAAGLDIGVTPTDPIQSPALAGAVIPAIGATAAREVVFLAFTTAAAANDADGSGNPLVRTTVTDSNAASDVFVAAIVSSDIDTSAFSHSLAGKFRHPRCATCHGMQVAGTSSFQSATTIGFPHAGPLPGPTFPNNDPATCQPCHVTSTSFPVDGWQAPAASFDIRSRSVAELAQMAKNVPADETEHFVTDKRVLWALDSGVLPSVNGRNGAADDDHDGIDEPEDTDGTPRPVPGGSEEFIREIEAWHAGGEKITNADAVADIELVSRVGSAAGDGASRAPSMVYVANGSFDAGNVAATNPVGWLHIAFESDATDLVAGDTNSSTDVFRATIEVRAEEDATDAAATGGLNLKYLAASTVAASARNGTNSVGDAASTAPAIGGANGEFVAFASVATDLVGTQDGQSDVYLRQIGTTNTLLVSHAAGASTVGGNGESIDPAIADSGDAVAFASDASDLIGTDSNGVRDVYYANIGAGPTVTAMTRASVNDSGGQGNGGASGNPSICADGGRVLVAYESDKTDLVASIAATTNVYLFDTNTGGSILLNRKALPATTGSLTANATVDTPGNGDARNAVIADDGSAVMFETAADNIDTVRADDDNNHVDVVLVALDQLSSSGLLLPFRISVSDEGGDADGDSTGATFGSFAGASTTYPTGFTAYSTQALNLGTSDTTGIMTSFLSEKASVVADFSVSTTSGAAPLTVTFTDTSLGDPTAWSWDFDNDGNADSTEQNPTHTYTTAGTYTVVLTASNDKSSSSKTSANVVRAFGPPTADFSASATIGTNPLTITFTDLSTEATAWSWDFDNDGNADSTVQNPSHTYTTAGTYTVSLTATGPAGSATETKSDMIQVFDAVTVTFAPSKDNSLYSESPTFSNGQGDHIFAGQTNQMPASFRRALLEFDVSSIPSGATILAVEVEVTMTKIAEPMVGVFPPDQDFTLSPVSIEWGESTSNATGEEGSGIAAETGDATWNSAFHTSTAWTDAGGDFGAVSATTSISNTLTTYSFSSNSMANDNSALITDVQGWIGDVNSNHGWILRGPEDTLSGRRFASKDGGGTAPLLRVTYDPF